MTGLGRGGWRLLARCALAAMCSASFATRAETITLWHALSGKAGDAVQAQCARFNASQRDHVVQCSFQGDYAQLMQKAVASFRSGRQPTLVQFFDVAVRELIDSKAIVPIHALYAAQGDSAWQQDLLPPVRDWYSGPDAQLVGQPFNVSTALLYVNDSLLRRAGIGAPKTWDEVRQAGRALQAAGTRCAFVTDLDAWTTLEQVAAVEGLPIAAPKNSHAAAEASLRYTLDAAPLKAHLQRLADGHREGWLRLDGETRAGDVASAFRSGECAMVLAATGMWSGIVSTVGVRNEVSAHPIPVSAGSVRHRTNIGGAALYVMKGATPLQQSAAAAFLRFARQPSEQLEFSDATGFLPYTQEAMKTWRTREAQAARARDAIEAGLVSLAQPAVDAAPGLRLGFYPQFRAAWKEEAQRLITGHQDVAQAVRNVERRGDELLRRYALTYKTGGGQP